MTNIIVIPDAHTKPGQNLRRFNWLGKFIIDRQPDIILCLGDFADIESLCLYDKGKKSFEGRRYKKDIKASQEAMNEIFSPIRAYNSDKKALRKKQYKPKLYLTLGNHEHRISRVSELSPELDEVISISDLEYEKWGWKVIPYLSPLEIEGVTFSHYFSSGVMNRAISGEHPAYALATKKFKSCIQGHSHIFDYCERTDASGKKIQCIVAGCFLDKDEEEAYAGEANKLWQKGLLYLHNVKDGEYDHEWVSVQRLEALYG